MKWPKSLTLIRHAQSTYNVLRNRKDGDEEHQSFATLFDTDPASPELTKMAQRIREKFALKCTDRETPLTLAGHQQAEITGRALKTCTERPDVIFVSPYLRTQQTYNGLVKSWPELADVPKYDEERIREQDHGLSLLYNDWRVFHSLHPEQRELYNLLGPYDYRYPNGENVPDVRARTRDMMTTIIREYAERDVWMITHHLTILSIRANQERLGPEEFRELDEHMKPANCGVTVYQGIPNEGKNGIMATDSSFGRYTLSFFT